MVTSTREKRLWFWTFAVFAAIFSTLFIGKPLATHLQDQNIQAAIFVLGMLLAAGAVVTHGLKAKPSSIELSVLLGITAVYIMFAFRLGAPERSHLVEYSVLAIFIHKALIERARHTEPIVQPALFAWIIAFFIGVTDESIQIVLPNRVFDIVDILFNGIAVTMAIASTLLLNWAHNRTNKLKDTNEKLK